MYCWTAFSLTYKGLFRSPCSLKRFSLFRLLRVFSPPQVLNCVFYLWSFALQCWRMHSFSKRQEALMKRQTRTLSKAYPKLHGRFLDSLPRYVNLASSKSLGKELETGTWEQERGPCLLGDRTKKRGRKMVPSHCCAGFSAAAFSCEWQAGRQGFPSRIMWDVRNVPEPQRGVACTFCFFCDWLLPF